jgi:hypothetical protein
MEPDSSTDLSLSGHSHPQQQHQQQHAKEGGGGEQQQQQQQEDDDELALEQEKMFQNSRHFAQARGSDNAVFD